MARNISQILFISFIFSHINKLISWNAFNRQVPCFDVISHICSWTINNLEECCKLNILQDHILKSILLQEHIANMLLKQGAIWKWSWSIWLSKFFQIINGSRLYGPGAYGHIWSIRQGQNLQKVHWAPIEYGLPVKKIA